MPLRKSLSFWTLLVCAACVLLTSFGFYPKWNKPGSEAFISWDASGYYLYLPATFIYHDLQQVSFLPDITRQYGPDPYQNQVYLDSLSGNRVMKYPAGLAVQSLPFFAASHLAAQALGYPADGFSAPYQLGWQLGSQLVAVLGLGLVWQALRRRFGEGATALTLVVLVLGTNYLDYAAIDAGMTHSWLFTLYAALLLLTPAFYERPTALRALGIGGLCGLMALTRPTDILAVLLPLLWGLQPTRAALQQRLAFWRQHGGKLLLAVAATAAVGSIQLGYWHYVTGRWLVYSYGEQGFSWLRPHLLDGLFSFRNGWLVYTPLMVTALLGFGPLRRQQPEAFWALLVFAVLLVYVTFAWDIWWYGGSLGARALVQGYAVLAWPLAAALRWVLARPARAGAYAALLLGGIYLNLWMTYQAHGGNGLMAAGEMTRPYFWRVVGRFAAPPAPTRWLLDNVDQVLDPADRRNVRALWQEDFEQAAGCATPGLQGRCALALDAQQPRSPEWRIPVDPQAVRWVHVRAQARFEQKEWDYSRLTLLTVRFQRGDELVKERNIRLQRVLEPGWPAPVYLDIKAPKGQAYDNVTVRFTNPSPLPVVIDDIHVEAFEK